MEFGTDVLDEFWHGWETAGDDADCELGRAPQAKSTEFVTFIRGIDEAPRGVSAHNRRQTSPSRPH